MSIQQVDDKLHIEFINPKVWVSRHKTLLIWCAVGVGVLLLVLFHIWIINRTSGADKDYEARIQVIRNAQDSLLELRAIELKKQSAYEKVIVEKDSIIASYVEKNKAIDYELLITRNRVRSLNATESVRWHTKYVESYADSVPR